MTVVTHEHAGHPDFRGVVLRARLRDGVPDETYSDGSTMTHEEDRRGVEDHALLYTDGYVALTIYEHCYCTWSAWTGECMGGSLWTPGSRHRDVVLTADALAALRPHAVGVLINAVASTAAAVVTARESLARASANKVVDHELARVRLVAAEIAHRDAVARRSAHP